MKNDVVIVAARNAYPEFQRFAIGAHSAYLFQQNMKFPDADFLAFYAGRGVQPFIAKIVEWHENVDLFGQNSGEIGELVKQCLASRFPHARMNNVIILSGTSDAQTIDLGKMIPNNLAYPFVRWRRYMSLNKLRDPTVKATSDLLN
jgi:hypothetical protein